MPELPEVETTRKGIEPFLTGKRIEFITVRNGNLRWPVPAQIAALRSVPVGSVLRRGKYLVILLDKGAMLVHLGMSGSMRVTAADDPLRKHDHVVFHLGDHRQIRFHDPRRFGSVLWSDDWPAHPLISSLGPEPLSEAFNPDYLHAVARGRSLAIKQLIMNSQVVVGVGNIYANEALYLSGIHPGRAASRISLKRLTLLVSNIKQVLSKAIAQGGTTLRDFVGSDGSPGYFKQELFVYGRAGMPCQQCAGALKEVRMNNRSTVFCPRCQT